MTDTRTQKAYNWAYSMVSSSIWPLKAIVYTMAKQPAKTYTDDMDEAVAAHQKLLDKLSEAADQFHRLYRLDGAKCLEEASAAVYEARSSWEGALRSYAAQDLTAALPLWKATLEKLQFAKDLLKRESPIRYRLWLLNPWLYYPKPLD